MKTVLRIFATVMLLVYSTGFAGDALIRDPAVTVKFVEDGQGGVHDWGWAYGPMWSARSSKNDVEYIGCGYRASELEDGVGDVYVYKWGFCQAKDVDEVHVVCYTENPEMLDAMQAITPFGWVQFEFTEPDHDLAGKEGVRRCTWLGFSTQSFQLPEFTTKGNKVSELGDK